eukprot:TRINITY_DN27461_c0_g1_i2.p1 TRINITY_DN27461_c0_g1~~TRINITY_DN27461_c0_g1_i2.p1  ORF type:complete len:439 (-),score=111.24 TRINITY_DN27461_c0_g1_i2:42-1358(-)
MPEVRVEAAGLLAEAEAVFDSQQPWSDHLPQQFKAVAGSLEVQLLVWNVMCRGRAGQVGRAGTALAGKTLTNNGLDYDETVEDYEKRLLERVAPVIAKWLVGEDGNDDRQSRPPLKLACLQELPAPPLLQEDLLGRLRTLSSCPQLMLAVQPSGGAVAEDGAAPFSTCTAILWRVDGSVEPTVQARLRPSGGGEPPSSLGLLLSMSGQPPVAVFSVHLPFVDHRGGPRYDMAVRQGVEAVKAFDQCGRLAAACAVIVAGDLNCDVEDVHPVLADKGCRMDMKSARHEGSATFRKSRVTTDACVAWAMGQGAAGEQDSAKSGSGESSGAEVAAASTDGIYRLGSSALWFGRGGRDDFLKMCIAKQLQDDPHVWRLEDRALASLGLWPFGEQPALLSRLRNRAKEAAKPKKKARLNNPLAAALGCDSESGSSGSDESDSE